MDLTALQNLLAALAALQQQVIDAQALIDQAYKKGFDDGAASIVIPPVTDKIYSEAELQAKIAEAVEPLQKKIEEMQSIVNAIPDQIAIALADFKVSVLNKIKDIEAVEMASLEDVLK